jgi:hypothetical protein
MGGGHDPEERDLWFLPGGVDEEPDFVPPMPRAEPGVGATIAAWGTAEAGAARPLARLSWRLGTLDARLSLGPSGWGHRLALMEAAELSWLAGDRIGADRVALWVAQRVSSVQDDARALGRAAWAFRRLAEGPGPEADLAAFLGRHEVEEAENGEALSDRLASWSEMMAEASLLHPVTRAALGYWAWGLAGLDRGPGGRIEAAAVAARIALPPEARGLRFVPLGLGGAGEGLRAGGEPEARLIRWIAGAEAAAIAALRHLDALADWERAATGAIAGMSGRTPPRLVAALVEWPLMSAPMAEAITGVSRASVHRGLDALAGQGLIREITGQGRFRFWAARLTGR